jgi:two-component system, cell cycle sensor histidine kinase and response regulator CckA
MSLVQAKGILAQLHDSTHANPEVSVKTPVHDENTLQETLRSSEVRYRRLFETAQDGILILDAGSGQITDANPFLLQLLSYTREELLGKQLWEIGFFRDRELSELTFEKLQKEGYVRYENLPLKSKDGRRREVEFVSNLYVVDDEKVIQCNIRDITDRSLLEAKLLQAQKMQAVGQLAGGVAHDFNNILTATVLQLSILLDDPSVAEDTKNALRLLETEARRAAGLIQQLLLFSRQNVVGSVPMDLNTVLANLLNMLRRLLSKDVRLEFQGGNSPLWIEADTNLIEQAVTNLCLNAQDAMAAKGGRLMIEAGLVKLGPETARANPEARPGLFACLSVTDTGCGMSAMTLTRIFEPFFTTKEVGKGTGLGLSTVYGVAKQHRGWVEVDSLVGRGTTFRVYFPALTKTPQAKPELPAGGNWGGKETILLVEDEAAVRHLVALGLRLRGYRVLEAASGPEAIYVWDQCPGEIDLLFADMRMPGGMTGMDLFERFKQTKASLKVVISSGYSEEIVKSQGPLGAGVSFLPKPYDSTTLARTVRHCLDSAGLPPRPDHPA